MGNSRRLLLLPLLLTSNDVAYVCMMTVTFLCFWAFGGGGYSSSLRSYGPLVVERVQNVDTYGTPRQACTRSPRVYELYQPRLDSLVGCLRFKHLARPSRKMLKTKAAHYETLTWLLAIDRKPGMAEYGVFHNYRRFYMYAARNYMHKNNESSVRYSPPYPIVPPSRLFAFFRS